jgi:flagellar biogenesis protein FliO
MGMLAVVLAVMGVALRFLRRYAMGSASINGAVKMEVMQRMTIGQRQGIAVVRVGQRVLVVSMGDGGVHPVAELSEADLTTPTPAKHAELEVATAKIAGGLRKLSLLRGGKSDTQAVVKPEQRSKRISYVAPMEDFSAVLSMAMGGAR